MAYLVFDRDRNGAETSAALARQSNNSPGELRAEERSTVLLSRNDTLLSLADPSGLLMRVMRCLGVKVANGLADTRLEALRRYAVILRIRGRASDDDLDRLFAAGFDSGQAAQVEQMIAQWRGHPGGLSYVSPGIALCIAAVLVYQLVAQAVDEQTIALILAGLSAVLLAPIVLPDQRRR